MNNLTTTNAQLPTTFEDLSKFVLIGREKLTAVRAEIRAIDKVGLAEEVRKQKLEEAQAISEAVLDAEVKIGELMAKVPKAQGKRTDKKPTDTAVGKYDVIKEAGFTPKQVERFETLAKNPDIVEQAKAEARANDDIVSRSLVLNMVKSKKKEEQQEIVEDEAPEPPAEPTTKLGDLWQLGSHRLICGDSTDIAVIDRLMDGAKVDCVFTDPPYNMSDNPSGFVSDEMKSRLDKIVDFDPNTVIDTLFAINTNNYFIFTSKELIPKYFKIFEEWGFNILVWCKDNPTPMTNNTFLPDVEYLLYFYKNGRVWNNGLDVSVYKKYYNSNKMEGRKEAGNVHPTIKPIKIISDKVQICSNKNGIVVDLFGGSGSTLIACEQLNRKCYMCELEPKYVDVIIDRWEKFTGQKAVKVNNEH